jgi:hypothetical protein
MKLLLFFNFFLFIKTKFNFVNGTCFTPEFDPGDTRLSSSIGSPHDIKIWKENQIIVKECVFYPYLKRELKCVNGNWNEVKKYPCKLCGQINNFNIHLKIFI